MKVVVAIALSLVVSTVTGFVDPSPWITYTIGGVNGIFVTYIAYIMEGP